MSRGKSVKINCRPFVVDNKKVGMRVEAEDGLERAVTVDLKMIRSFASSSDALFRQSGSPLSAQTVDEPFIIRATCRRGRSRFFTLLASPACPGCGRRSTARSRRMYAHSLQESRQCRTVITTARTGSSASTARRPPSPLFPLPFDISRPRGFEAA